MPGEWETFFFMVGSSATGLIGLLFVVITLNAETKDGRAEAGSRTYVTPTVVHFAAVLIVSTFAIMPGLGAQAAGVAVGTVGVLGFLYVGTILSRIIRGIPAPPPHWTDYIFYGVLPAAVYLGLVASAVCLWSGIAFGPYGVGIAALSLLLVGIRDAWDLATYLAYRPTP